MEEKTLKVSDLFVEIYTNLNVLSQLENMKKLSKKELYLLLIVALDKHSDDDPVVLHNLLPWKDTALEIFDLQEDKECTIPELIELVEETGDKYIDVTIIVDSNGNKLKDPLSKEEVRDAKINITIKND
jgi:phage terminase large subunit-like protein